MTTLFVFNANKISKMSEKGRKQFAEGELKIIKLQIIN